MSGPAPIAPSNDTRGRILFAAMRLFSEKGYGSTSVADILKEARANSGSLYNYFPTKQDVLAAVLAAYRDGITPMLLEPAWRGVTDPIERVFALLAAYRGLLEGSDCAYGCPIGSLALELHEPDPAISAVIAAKFDAWTGHVRGCFEAAAERFPPDTDLNRLAVLALTVMEGAVMQARTHRTLDHYDLCVAAFRDHLDLLLQKNLGKKETV